jgi:hypothetical protein
VGVFPLWIKIQVDVTKESPFAINLSKDFHLLDFLNQVRVLCEQLLMKDKDARLHQWLLQESVDIQQLVKCRCDFPREGVVKPIPDRPGMVTVEWENDPSWFAQFETNAEQLARSEKFWATLRANPC